MFKFGLVVDATNDLLSTMPLADFLRCARPVLGASESRPPTGRNPQFLFPGPPPRAAYVPAERWQPPTGGWLPVYDPARRTGKF